MKAQSFEFTSYTFNTTSSELSLTYAVTFDDADQISFTETVRFPQQNVQRNVSKPLLDRIFQNVHLMLGISYYKTYCPPHLELPYKLNHEQAVFWNTVYRNGLGEFLYRNNLDPEIVAEFPSSDLEVKPLEADVPHDSVLIGLGGGKDSAVVCELIREVGYTPSTFYIQYQKLSPAVIDDVVDVSGLNHLRIVRELDPQLLEKLPESFNGHVPASGIFAFLGIAAAALYGFRSVIVGNEYSSNFGNVEYRGMTVNHQWSKSQEFEGLLADYLRSFITTDIRYFSLLRPFYEYRISELFARYEQYFPVFSSCNRNFTVEKGTDQRRWCCRCAKCAFMFLMLATHLPRDKVTAIFGTDMFDDPALVPVFRDVLGLGEMKPFDCVGTFDEAAAAFAAAAPRWAGSAVVSALSKHETINPEALKEIRNTHISRLIPSEFVFSGMKNALVLGYGTEGKVTEKFLKQTKPDLPLGVSDQTEGDAYLAVQDSYDIALKTPGIPKRNVHIQYTTASNLFFAAVEKNMTIGITGTKGKSTTAALIAHILESAGKDVRLVGNIGAPMLGALLEPYDDEALFVIELSSYQLEDLAYSPRIAVFLNLYPEHMDYHGSVDQYYAAKESLFRYQRPSDMLVYNNDSPRVADHIRTAAAKRIPFADADILTGLKLPLLGVHNEDNVRAATAAARLLGITDDIIRQSVTTFRPLPHRLEFVGEYQGIRFYDDAISTTPESTIAALRALPDTETIFLGGKDRGYDFTALEQAILTSRIQNVVLFPTSGGRIFRSRPPHIRFLDTSRMEDAVAFAYQNTSKGAVCLLSTASPSHSIWKNFEEKGDEFKKWVRTGPRRAS